VKALKFSAAGMLLAICGLALLPEAGHSADSQTPASPTNSAALASSPAITTNSVAATPLFPAGVAPTHEKPRIKHTPLSGAELYSIHCNRCHPERYPTERTAAQWKTILLHMRVRANLPAEQARTILKYLQDNSGR
jgi:cytochrome c5